MQPYQINRINASLLIIIGMWGYLSSTSQTAILPVVFGGLLFAFTPWFRQGNKAIAHVVVLLTFIILLSFAMPLKGAAGRSDTGAVFRIAVMMVSCAVAMVF